MNNRVGDFFSTHWQEYQGNVNKNSLFHKEMFGTLHRFLNEHFAKTTFTLVDIGCGDSSAIVPALLNTNIKKYIGIDVAEKLIGTAANKLAAVNCEKQFICNDMQIAINHLNAPVDIFFSSYALHHLTSSQKIQFIDGLYNKLSPNGYFVLVDVVLEPNQTREGWLQAFENHLKKTRPEMTPAELTFQMQHPHEADFPESITTYAAIAKKQLWSKFQVLIDKGIFACVLFCK